MGKLCKLTGVEVPEEGLEPIIKKMCLNCLSCVEKGDGNDTAYTCTNENVIEAGKKKIMAALPEGFEIETLTLKPMLLKNPVKKCGNYAPNLDLIHGLVDKMVSE